ncbi:MAG TPA: MFS transporter [Nitrososphaerales archaeon]|nr:MFS transporter [Nitrososphaerales archaeon]
MADVRAAREWLALAAVNLGNFVTPLDTGIMTVVLPTIAADLGGLQYARLVLLIPLESLLIEAAFMPVFGRFSDAHGRKRWFVIGLCFFSLGAFLSGQSSTVVELLVFRVVQALGAAFILANGRALIADTFSPKRRGLALGLHVSTLYVATALGVFLTTSIVSITALVGWRYIFYVSGTIAAASIPLSVVFIKESPKTQGKRTDWLGAFFLVAALGGTLFVLTQVPQYGWGNFSVYVQDFRLPFLNIYYYLNAEVTIPLELVGLLSLASGILFVVTELRVQSPIIDFGLFRRNRMFLSTNASAFALYTAHWGTLITLSFYLEEVRHLSILASGLLLLVEPVAVACTAVVGGLVASRTGSRDPTIVGMGIAAVALLSLATISTTSGVLYLAFLLAVLGIGVGIFAPGNTNANLGSVPPSDRGMANGVLGMMRFTGQSLSIAIGSYLAGDFLLGQCFGKGCTYTPGQAAGALDIYFVVGAVIAVVGIAFAYFGRD